MTVEEMKKYFEEYYRYLNKNNLEVVCKPYDEKRAYAAFKKIMPEYDVIIHS